MKGDSDILKTIIDAVNGISAYLREQARNVPDESNWGAMQLLPGPVELPTQDYRPKPPPVAEVVVPLPRQRPYDEGYMLPEPPVEWGRPASDSNTGSVSTIDLIVTNKEGEDFDPEQEITVYIRKDQSEVDITPREWDTDTLLSFVRFEKDSLDVSGVLVGEGQHEPPLADYILHDGEYAPESVPPGNCTFRAAAGGIEISAITDKFGHLKGITASS